MGINVHCKGSGVNEVGLSDSEELLVLVKVNSKFFGPLESDNYLADYSKAREKLGWEPKTGLRNFVNIMAKHDLSIMESQGH